MRVGDHFLAGKKMSEQSELFFPRRKLSPTPLQPPRAQATKPKPPGNNAYHPKPGQLWSGRHSPQPAGKPSTETSTAAGPAPAARPPHPPASPAAQTSRYTDETPPQPGHADPAYPGWHR